MHCVCVGEDADACERTAALSALAGCSCTRSGCSAPAASQPVSHVLPADAAVGVGVDAGEGAPGSLGCPACLACGGVQGAIQGARVGRDWWRGRVGLHSMHQFATPRRRAGVVVAGSAPFAWPVTTPLAAAVTCTWQEGMEGQLQGLAAGRPPAALTHSSGNAARAFVPMRGAPARPLRMSNPAAMGGGGGACHMQPPRASSWLC